MDTTKASRAAELRASIQVLERDLEQARTSLKQLVATCRHEWSEAKYDPTVRPAHTIPGDKPGTMGVDFRGPTFVPEEVTPRWTRTCRVCGHVEATQRVKEEVKKTPVF